MRRHFAGTGIARHARCVCAFILIVVIFNIYLFYVTLQLHCRPGNNFPDWKHFLHNVRLKRNKMETEYVLNDHNKEEFPPAHTAEHLINQTMVRMFGCERSNNAHIERKKSKISYVLDHKPSRKEEKAIEQTMNELIAEDLPVTFEFVKRSEIPAGVSTDRLPDDASETIRLVRIGDYDVCPCIGRHVRSTSQIGRFEMLGTNWDEMTHTFRIRFKVVQ